VLASALEVFSQGRNMARLGEGLWVTVEISAVSVALSMFFGVLAGLMMTSRSRWLRVLPRIYLEIVRVIPILVLLYLFYYFPAKNWDINLSAKTVAVLVFTLWGAAEMADLVRGALTSMPVHQRESGRAIGLTESQVNKYIIIPQAVRRLIPGVINLTTRMIKTTPFIFFINEPELIKVGQQIVEAAGMDLSLSHQASYLASFWVYGAIFLIYFAVCYPVSRFSVYLEKKWSA